MNIIKWFKSLFSKKEKEKNCEDCKHSDYDIIYGVYCLNKHENMHLGLKYCKICKEDGYKYFAINEDKI